MSKCELGIFANIMAKQDVFAESNSHDPFWGDTDPFLPVNYGKLLFSVVLNLFSVKIVD